MRSHGAAGKDVCITTDDRAVFECYAIELSVDDFTNGGARLNELDAVFDADGSNRLRRCARPCHTGVWFEEGDRGVVRIDDRPALSHFGATQHFVRDVVRFPIFLRVLQKGFVLFAHDDVAGRVKKLRPEDRPPLRVEGAPSFDRFARPRRPQFTTGAIAIRRTNAA